MRFTQLLLALPLIGAVLATPVKEVKPVKRDVDVLSIATELQTTVVSAPA
jgi:hypothetical protein